MSIFEKLQHFRKVKPDFQALVSPERSICYAELAEIVKLAAVSLYQNGIKPGDNVGLLIADELEHMIASLSLMVLGTRQITLASHDSCDTHQDIILRTNANWIVVDRLHLNSNFQNDINYIVWPNLNELSINNTILPKVEGILFINTSGTSAKSNIILFTETQITHQARSHRDYGNERLMRLSSVEFNTSKRHRLYSIWNGGCNVFRPNGDLQEVITYALSQHVTYLDVSRMHISELCSIPNIVLPEGMRVRPGGSEVPLGLRHQFSSLFPSSLYVRYATTETGAISMAGPDDHLLQGSCGKPLAGVSVEIVDEGGEILPANSVGEIRVQTQGMATAYLDNPEQTAKRFRDGWFYPGDKGYLNIDGQLVVCGRKDDMIILNGINIFPNEIEHALELHPKIAFAIALSLPSDIHGHIPVAAVQLKPGSKATLDELMIYSREKLALKCPRRILIVDALPRNNQGKLLRREAHYLFENNKPKNDDKNNTTNSC
jgi:long-chain acyl-CoA synthetase